MCGYLLCYIVVQASKEAASKAVRIVRHLLESLSFVISEEKSEEDPSQVMEYIGLNINTLTMTFSLPEKKASDIKRCCQSALKKRAVTLREMALLLGNFNWAAAAVDFAQSHFRGFQAFYILNLRSAGGDLGLNVELDRESMADLRWWSSEAVFLAGSSIHSSPSVLSFSSDASRSGWGAVCQEVRTGGPWTASDLNRHINHVFRQPTNLTRAD